MKVLQTLYLSFLEISVSLKIFDNYQHEKNMILIPLLGFHLVQTFITLR